MSFPDASLLSELRSQLTVDVDSMDPDVAARHTTARHSFCEMTSNQAIVYSEATRTERADVLESAIRTISDKSLEPSLQQTVDDIVDLLVRSASRLFI